MPENEIEKSIEENALGPKSVESDGQKVEQRPIAELIEADRYLNSKKAMQKKGLGIKIAKLIPPGGA
jgi:hypothetical protein